MAANAALIPLFIALAILVVLRRRQQSNYLKDINDVHHLPAPKDPHWLWGHEKEVFDRPQPEAYNAWADEFGGAYRIDGALWYGDILVPTDPEIITHIFTRNAYKYTKSPSFRPLIERLIGRSIIWAEGDEHQRMSKVLAGCFKPESVREMHEAVVESAQRLNSLLRSHVLDKTRQEPDAAHAGVLTNIIGWPSRATLDIIGRVGFDHDFGCGESLEAKEIARLWNEQIEMSITFPGFIAHLLLRALPILNSLLPLKIKEAQAATKMHIHRLALDLAQGAIKARRAELAQLRGHDGTKFSNGNGSVSANLLRRRSGRQDLLSALVRASVQDDAEVNLDELLDHIATFVMAGHETSAGVIKYTLYALSKDQERQDKLRAELSATGFSATCGIGGREPTYDELTDSKTLPYLDAVVKEALRLHVTTASTERVAQEDDVIPLKKPILAADGKTVLNSIHVPKGQLIAISWLCLNSNSRTWGPDSMTFKPERWLAPTADPLNSALPHAVTGGYQNMGTFSEGPRMCLGYRLAILEIKAILLALVRDFQFGAVDRVPVRDPATGRPTGEMMDVKVESIFGAGLLQPRIKGGEKAGMGSIWLPVIIRLMEDVPEQD